MSNILSKGCFSYFFCGQYSCIFLRLLKPLTNVVVFNLIFWFSCNTVNCICLFLQASYFQCDLSIDLVNYISSVVKLLEIYYQVKLTFSWYIVSFLMIYLLKLVMFFIHFFIKENPFLNFNLFFQYRCFDVLLNHIFSENLRQKQLFVWISQEIISDFHN